MYHAQHGSAAVCAFHQHKSSIFNPKMGEAGILCSAESKLVRVECCSAVRNGEPRCKTSENFSSVLVVYVYLPAQNRVSIVLIVPVRWRKIVAQRCGIRLLVYMYKLRYTQNQVSLLLENSAVA